MIKWKIVDENTPRDGRELLLFYSDGIPRFGAWKKDRIDGSKYWDCNGCTMFWSKGSNPTHWSELNEPVNEPPHEL